MAAKFIESPTIGAILREEFLEPLDITPYRLAKELKVSTSTVLDILHDRRKITVEMALRLSRFFGNSSTFWLNLQNELDVRDARNKLETVLETIQPYGCTCNRHKMQKPYLL